MEMLTWLLCYHCVAFRILQCSGSSPCTLVHIIGPLAATQADFNSCCYPNYCIFPVKIQLIS